MRDVTVSVPSSSTLSLGLTLQWCPVSTTDDIWHILDVAANSPADYAGLLPYSDYILGTPEGLVRGESGLGELVEAHMDRPLRLYVYNHEYDVTRELHITPTRSWGGEGALGCVLGFGALHRIPAPLHEPVQAPGELLFSNSPRPSGDLTRPPVDPDDEEFPPPEPGLVSPLLHHHHQQQQQQQFTPVATMSDNPAFRGTSPGGHLLSAAKSSPTPPPPRNPVAARHKARHTRPFDMNMDDYLREGELKSRELESNRSSPATLKPGLPPPPRRTAPPPLPPKASTPAPGTDGGAEEADAAAVATKGGDGEDDID